MMKRLLVILAVVLLIPSVAGAEQIGLTWNAGERVTVRVNGSVFYDGWAESANIAVLAGPGPDLPWGVGEVFLAYCVDLDHYGYNNSTSTATVADLGDWTMSSATSGGASLPPAGYAAGSYASFLLNSFARHATTTVQQAGLQIAIWDVLYELTPSWGASTGRITFTATSSALAWADTYLGQIPIGDTSEHAGWLQTANLDLQGHARSMQDFGYAVPEPGSMLLLGTGLLGLGGVIRRRRRS